MNHPVVEVERLTKSYGTQPALRGIDLSFAGGGIVGLLGPNGAGKTTLVEILEGLREPTSGRVSVLGLDPTKTPRAVKEKIGVQLQSTAIPADLTALEVVKLYGALYRKSLPPAKVLVDVGLEEKMNVRAGTLSGGQRQRLALAMAMVHDPELVLLDEPTTGLDPVARRSLHEIVRNLKKQGRSVFLTTHYIEEAELLCDRVIVVRAGEVVADGTPFELLRRASGISTLWIAVDGPLDPAPLVASGAQLAAREGEHYRFTTHDPTAAILALSDLLRAQELKLTDVRMRRPTLEDVYLELVGPEALKEALKDAGDGAGAAP
jgi:ABC-2 type transport system ATP-binding protein